MNKKQYDEMGQKLQQNYNCVTFLSPLYLVPKCNTLPAHSVLLDQVFQVQIDMAGYPRGFSQYLIVLSAIGQLYYCPSFLSLEDPTLLCSLPDCTPSFCPLTLTLTLILTLTLTGLIFKTVFCHRLLQSEEGTTVAFPALDG